MKRTILSVLTSVVLASVSICSGAQNANPLPASRTAADKQQDASITVSAGQPNTSPDRSTFGPESDELASLQRQIPLWKARAEIAKYQAEVRKSDPAPSLSTPLPGAATLTAQAPTIPVSAPTFADSARALSLRAYDGKYSAVVELNGQATPVHVGDTLDGGWKVASMSEAGIKLVNGKRVRILKP